MDRSPICFDDDDDDTDDDTDDDDDDGDDDIEEYPRALTLSLFQGKTAEPAEFYCFTPLPVIHLYLYLCYTHRHTHTHPSACLLVLSPYFTHTHTSACYTHLSLLYFTPLPVC